MAVKRVFTLIFGLILISMIAKSLVLYFSPPFRLHGVGYAYDYTKLNYIQFAVLFLIPSVAAFFLWRADFKIIDSFYDRIAGAIKKIFLAGVKNKEKVLTVAVVIFWVFSLMEYSFFSNMVESNRPFSAPFAT